MTKRVRREPPTRTGPNRNWSTLFRGADAWSDQMRDSDSDMDTGRKQKRPIEGVAAEAVEKGYKVIEEQIRQGQQFAREFAERTSASGIGDAVSSDLVERLMSFYTDLGALWFEMVESIARNPAVADLLPGRRKQHTNGHANGNGHSNVPIEINSSRPVDIKMSLDMGALAPGGAPIIVDLRAMDTRKPAITDIRFDEGNDEWSPVLRIRVPESQPADIYSGVIIDSSTNQPIGTMCVRVSEKNEVDD